MPGVTQHSRVLSSLPCSRLHKNCKDKFPLCSVCAYTCVCAHICACVDAMSILCRPAAAAGPYPGPQPSGQLRQLTWDGWLPDFQAMLTHHSISCLWIDSSQAVLILAWCSPRPSKSIEDTAQLTGLQGPVKLTAISAGAQHGPPGRRISSQENHFQPSPGDATETLGSSVAGYGPFPVFPSRRGSKRHQDSHLGEGSNDINQNA